MINKSYSVDIDGRNITVTTEDIASYYGERYTPALQKFEGNIAFYIARIKVYKECPRWLDKTLVRRLLDEEHLMKLRETDGFKLDLAFTWYAELKREGLEHLPFQYAVDADCLDNRQSFSHRYVSMQDALLHCLNGFNENVNVPDRYRSIEEYLADPTVK